jgi:predicted nucleotidyltransferase
MLAPLPYRQFVLNLLHERLDNIHRFGVHSLALFGSVALKEAKESADNFKISNRCILNQSRSRKGFFAITRVFFDLQNTFAFSTITD